MNQARRHHRRQLLPAWTLSEEWFEASCALLCGSLHLHCLTFCFTCIFFERCFSSFHMCRCDGIKECEGRELTLKELLENALQDISKGVHAVLSFVESGNLLLLWHCFLRDRLDR